MYNNENDESRMQDITTQDEDYLTERKHEKIK